MILRIATILLMIVSITSCGGKGAKDTTKANIVILGGIASGIPGMTGGTKIYGFNNATGETLNLTYNGQSSITLSNGPWGFSAVTWDGDQDDNGTGDGGVLEGKVYCGSTDMFLAGGDVAVNLTLTHAGCDDDFFGGPEAKEGDGQFKIFQPYKCIDEKGVYDTDDPCDASLVGSYKVELPDGFGLPGLESRCFSEAVSNTPEMAATGSRLRVPIIAFYDNSFAMKVKLYESTACSGDELVVTIDNPYAGFSTPVVAKFDDSGTPGANQMRIHVDPCNFTTGNGATPYYRPSSGARIVCNENQFDNIETISLSDVYELHRDLDFTGFPDFNSAVVSGTFIGRLLGRGHSISNISFDTSGLSNVGIFSTLDGTSLSGYSIVEDLELKNIDIQVEDGSRVGALAGFVDGGARIDRLQVKNVDIYATSTGGTYNGVGGLIGEMGAYSFSELHALSIVDVNIDTEDGYRHIGGVVGTMGDDNYFRFAKVHDVDIDTTASGSETAFGGVIGLMEGPDSEIAGVTATNINIGTTNPPSGILSMIGGFVGSMTGGNIYLCKVTGNLVSMATSGGQIGGFAGHISAATGGTSVHESISDVDIDSVSSKTGGFAGEITNATSSSINLSGNRSLGVIEACGDYCGGFAGKVENSSASGNLSVSKSYSKSNLESFTSAPQGYVGGFSGYINQASAGPINITESFSAGYVSASATDYVGGFVGNMYGASLVNIYSESIVEAIPSASYTASLIGSGSNGTINHTFASGTSTPGGNCINGSAASTAYNYCLDGNSGSASYSGTITSKSATDILNLSSSDFNSDPSWTADPESRLVFFKAIEDIGEAFTGTYFDPIVLTSTTQWNAIKDNEEFMKKTFMLGADISFGNADCGSGFNPIGSTSYPFKGHLLGNDKTISDIDCDETGGSPEALGLIRTIGNDVSDGAGSVQHYDIFDHGSSKALYVDNVHFATDQDAVGVIAGEVYDSGTDGGGHNDRHAARFANIHVTNSSVTQGGSFDAGGLIGYMNLTNERSVVFKSSFKNGTISHNAASGYAGGIIGSITGTLAASWSNYIDMPVLVFEGTMNITLNQGTGGLVGLLDHDEVEITVSRVDSTDITGSYRVGGAVGNCLGGVIRDSYVNANITGINYIGGFAGSLNGNPITLKGNLVEGSAVCTHATTCDVGGFAGEIATPPNIRNNIALATSSCDTATTCNAYPFSTGGFTLGGTGINFQIGGTDTGGLIKAITAAELLDSAIMDSYGLDHGDPWLHFDGERPQLFWEVFPEFLERN